MSRAAHRLEHLRRLRARPGRELSIGGEIQRIAGDAKRTQRKLGELIDLWQRLVPPELAVQTAITALRGGIAQVQVDSAAAAFELDRLLRGGLLTQLRGNFSGTLTRVKVKVGG